MSTTVTFLFAGDGSLASDGLSAFLQTKSNYILVSECQDGASTIANIESLNPQIAVVDVRLPDMGAGEIAGQVRAKGLRTKIVVLGATANRETADRLLAAGADAYVVRSGPSRHLTEAIRYVLDNGKYLAPELTVEQPVGASQQAATRSTGTDEAIAGLRAAVDTQGRTVERLEQAMARAEYAIEMLQQKVEQLAGTPIDPPPTPPAGPEGEGETRTRSSMIRRGLGAVAAMLVVGVLGFHLAGILRPKAENVIAEFANGGGEDVLNSSSASALTSPAWENSMVEEATALFKNQRYDSAEKICRRLLQANPSSVAAKRVLASVLFHQDKIAEAADVVSAMASPLPAPLRRIAAPAKPSFLN